MRTWSRSWGLWVALWGVLGAVGRVEAATPFEHGMVSITLDDGWPTQYTEARPVLQAHSLPVTYFLVTEGIRLGWTGYMTPTQVQTLVAEGNEVGSHTLTHPDLTTVSDSQLLAEVRDSQAWLRSTFGLTGVTDFASPYGAYDDRVLQALAPYYTSHRTVNGGPNFRDSNRMQLRAYDVQPSIGVDEVRGWIDQALADGTWLILVFHQFTSGTPSQTTEYNTADFSAILDHVRARGLRTVTISEGLAMMETSTGSATEGTSVYDDVLGDGFADWSWATHDMTERGVVHGGLYSISAGLAGWNALYLHHATGLDASQYSALSLWVNGGTTGGQGIRVAFYDGSRALGSARLDTLLGHPIQAGTWQQVTLPLASVGLASGTVRDLYIQDDTGGSQGTLYLDDLKLVRASTSTPPPSPPRSSGFVIYGDAFATGFYDWSWATHDATQGALVHSGTHAISAELDGWASLFFHTTDGVALSPYSSLELWVHGGTTGGQLARLVLQDAAGHQGDIRLETALGHPIQAGVWQRISIPLSSFGSVSGTLQELYIQDQSGGDQGTLYLDDIQLVP